VSKRYLGIVNGPVRKESGTISLNLLKTSSKYGGWRMVASHEGKPASPIGARSPRSTA
jgi:tRNA pseudouridine32 synthase/23S rRNA pseudouridine746 synthase